MSTASKSHLTLIGSVPVPNVQELSASISTAFTGDGGAGEIPARYIRPEAEADAVASAEGDEIPVIDLSKLLDLELLDDQELSSLGFACREWGFFQLLNHGVPEELLNKTKNDIIDFFKLPLKEKEKIKQLPGQIEGYGQVFVHTEEQKLDWADVIILSIQPLHRRNMRFWPTQPFTFSDTLSKYSSEISRVASCLFKLMAKDLGVDPEVFNNLFSCQMETLRISYYPPCKQASKVLGLSPHSDASGMTILLQVNEVNGLQIKKDGKWFPVKPHPGALIVNVGDTMEITSNGKYKSREHRVVINREKERLSVATFFTPDLDVVIRPLPDLIDQDGQRYRSISVAEYAKAVLSSKLDGKNLLESMKL